MLRRLLALLSSRPQTRTNAFRPRLEALEDRVTPQVSAMTPDFGSPGSSLVTDNGDPTQSSLFAQQTLLAFGLPPSGYALYSMGGEPVGGYAATPLQTVSNATGGGFGGAASAGTLSGTGVGGGNGGGSGFSTAQVEQLAATLYRMAAMENPQAANALVLDEVFKAVDTYIDDLGKSIGINDPKLEGQINAYQNAINQNPVEQSPGGPLLGNLMYNLTLNSLENGQASAL